MGTDRRILPNLNKIVKKVDFFEHMRYYKTNTGST